MNAKTRSPSWLARSPSWLARSPRWLAGSPRWLARVFEALLLGSGVISVGVASLRILPVAPPFPFSAIEAEAQWMLPIALLGLALSIISRARWSAGLHGVATIGLLLWVLEWTPSAWSPRRVFAHSTPLRIVTSNLLAPNPSAPLARELLATDADILLLQELSDSWWELLQEEGVSERFPYQTVDPHPVWYDCMGIGLLSRIPLEHAETRALLYDWAPMAHARAEVGGQRLCFYSVHTLSPVTPGLLESQNLQTDQLARIVGDALQQGECTIAFIGGDFNASATSRAHRVLKNAGWLDAHERVGRGFAFTWPNGRARVPPMRLDHVYLVGGPHAEIAAVREGEGRGSDHRPVIVDLDVEMATSTP